MSNAILEVEDVKDSIQGTEGKITVVNVNGVETEEYSKEKKEVLGLTTGINKTWKESVSSYMKIAKVCASAWERIKDDSNMEYEFMKRLTFGDKVFKKFVKIGNANLEKLYGADIVSSINDYNVLSELSKNDMIADNSTAKEKRKSLISAVKTAIAEKKTVNRELVEEFTKVKKTESDIDTKVYDKVVASIRVNSSSFTTTEDLASLNKFVNNILSDFSANEIDIVVDKKNYETDISNKISALEKLLNNNKNLQLVRR